MNKTILLTGAAGFTGQHFIRLANQAGYQCIALVHKKTDQAVDGLVDCQAVVADLTDKVALKQQLTDLTPDYVVHLAAVSFVAHGDAADIYRTNLIGTVNLLDCLIELGKPLKKVLIASSGNVYGNHSELPIHEELVPVPVNDYGVSKMAVELAASVRFVRLPIILVRPFNYTGVGQAEHFLIAKIVAAFKRKAPSIELGNLDVARDFSDVRDVVSTYLKLLESEAHSAVFNLCSGKAVSLLSVIEQLNTLAGYEIEVKVNQAFVRANEIKTLYGSNDKLSAVIGQQQQYQLSDTLRWMIQE